MADESETDDSTDDSKPPSAMQLLMDVRHQLPHEHLDIDGDISILKWGSGIQSKLRFNAVLDLAASPSFAQYTILDVFGKELEQLTITRSDNAPPEFSYASGSPLVLRSSVNPSKEIRNTGITWLDLTMSFIWWNPEPEVLMDTIRNRKCYVIKVIRPNKDKENNGYNAARLWIDKKAHVLLQAEAIDSENKVIRKLWVKSIKKINGRWMIKDMEVAGRSTDIRTRISIRNVKTTDNYDN